MKSMIYDWSMKIRSDDNDLVTKGYLRQEFKREFAKFRHDFSREIDFKIDQKFDEKLGGLRDDLVIWKDEILTSNDKVIKKLDTWLTERAMIHGNYQRLEARVTTLENSPLGK